MILVQVARLVGVLHPTSSYRPGSFVVVAQCGHARARHSGQTRGETWKEGEGVEQDGECDGKCDGNVLVLVLPGILPSLFDMRF